MAQRFLVLPKVLPNISKMLILSCKEQMKMHRQDPNYLNRQLISLIVVHRLTELLSVIILKILLDIFLFKNILFVLITQSVSSLNPRIE